MSVKPPTISYLVTKHNGRFDFPDNTTYNWVGEGAAADLVVHMERGNLYFMVTTISHFYFVTPK